jgi:hypothetical protein
MLALGSRLCLAVCVTAGLLLSSCSKNPLAPTAAVTNPATPPDTYPPIPRPTSPSEVTPDTSESYYAIAPIEGKQADFAPTWSEGVFTWHIDVQTIYYDCFLTCQWDSDPPGPYWDGTARNTALVFEGGQVDLRSPDAFPNATRRLQFVSAGKHVDSPVNPDMQPNQVVFSYAGAGTHAKYPNQTYNAVFGGSKWRNEKPGFLEQQRGARYQLAALSCPKLTNQVFLRRQRFWQRVYLNGQNGGGSLKSVIIDPGATYSVTYTRLQGVDNGISDTFTRTISAEVGLSTPEDVADVKLGGSLSDAFATSVTSHQETSTAETQTFNGQDGKTVVYSVWRTVERYTFVDKDGNPFTDPNFTFADLGRAEILGDFERLESTSFPYGSAPLASAMKAEESVSKLNPKGVAR